MISRSGRPPFVASLTPAWIRRYGLIIVFVAAVTLAAKFTRPVVVSSRSRAGTVTSGCGSFVLVNDEGWILTAAHLIQPLSVLNEHQKAHAEYLEKSAQIEARTDLKSTKKKHLVSKLGFKSDWLSSVSFGGPKTV